MNKYCLCLFVLLLLGCSPGPEQANLQVIFIHVTSSTLPWLEKANTCAETSKINLSNTANSEQADIMIRLGEPINSKLTMFAIDHEDVLVLTNSESPIQNLQLLDVQKLFTQPGDLSTEVWAYSSSEDIQQVFHSKVLPDLTLLSTARLAITPQQMGEALNQNKNSIGILTRHWKAGNLREVFTIKDVPVLAMTKTEPTEQIKELIYCLQK